MAFCPNCGAEASGKFCAACGRTLDPASGPTSTTTSTSTASLSTEVAGALCYVLGLVTGVLFLVLEPYNRDRAIRFHAFHSIFFSVAWVVITTVWAVAASALSLLPFVGGLFAGTLGVILGWGFVIIWLLLIVQTYRGKKMLLPVIGPLAEKQAG